MPEANRRPLPRAAMADTQYARVLKNVNHLNGVMRRVDIPTRVDYEREKADCKIDCSMHDFVCEDAGEAHVVVQ